MYINSVTIIIFVLLRLAQKAVYEKLLLSVDNNFIIVIVRDFSSLPVYMV